MDPRIEIVNALLNTCYVSSKAFEGICNIVDEGAFSTTSGEPFDNSAWTSYKDQFQDV